MRAPTLSVANGEIPRRRAFIRLAGMGHKLSKTQNTDRSSQDGCAFCGIVKGVGTRKIYEDDLLVAFHDAHPAAKLHILVCPKQHIISTRHLRNSQADKDLLMAMLELGTKLVAEHDQSPDPESIKTKFGFHTPPFLSVPHLHLHCFALPHRPSYAAYQYLQTPGGHLGFITVEQALQQLEAQEPYTADGESLPKKADIQQLPNGKA